MNMPLAPMNSQSLAQIASSVLLTDEDTAGAFALVATTLPPFDPGAPPHAHPHHAEGCYVLAGALGLTQREQTITLSAGTAVRVPAGVTHTYWNPTAVPTVLLLIYTPAVPAELAAALAAGRPGGVPPYLDSS